MSGFARSVSEIPIRLTDERWEHIVSEHGELEGMQQCVLDAISNPEKIVQGNGGELLALREFETNKWMVAVYREFEDDGFVITAFYTRRRKALDRRKQLWP